MLKFPTESRKRKGLTLKLNKTRCFKENYAILKLNLIGTGVFYLWVFSLN